MKESQHMGHDSLRSSVQRWRSLLTLAALSALAFGCTPEEAPRTEQPPETEVEILRPIELTENALLPESDARLMDVEIRADGLVFVYSSEPAAPPAIDQVVSGVLHGGYLRRITGILSTTPTATGGVRIDVSTVPAQLVELIGDGHFRVQLRPRDGDSSFRVVDGVGLATGALDGGWSLLTPEYRNISCGGGAGGSVDVSPTFDMDVDVDIEIDIRWSTRFLVVPVGELHAAHFILSGQIEAGASIETSGNQSISCSWDLLAAATGGMVPSREWVTTFPVGPVPVVITHTIEPSLSIEIGGEVQTGASTATYTGRIGVRAGAEYARDTGWQPVWQPSRTGSANLTTSQPGQLTISAGATGGIGYQAKLYDTVGPGVALEPGVSGEFVVSADRCTWTAEAKAGIDLNLNVSLDIPVFDYSLAEYSASQNLAEGTIAMAEGTFPWCEDAGTPDGGTVTPRDGGTVTPPVDGGSDPCNTAGSTCQDCNALAGCGLCAATGECMRDSRRSECDPTQWRDSPSECEDCTGHADCSSCVGDGFCGWCNTTGTCLTATTGGGSPVPCADWNYGRIFMCGG